MKKSTPATPTSEPSIPREPAREPTKSSTPSATGRTKDPDAQGSEEPEDDEDAGGHPAGKGPAGAQTARRETDLDQSATKASSPRPVQSAG
jgi:hypothetical protein